MRFVVLLLGLLGSGLAGAFGYLCLTPGSGLPMLADYVPGLSRGMDVLELGRAGLFLLLGAILGSLGALLAFFRCGPQGGILMLVALVGPGVFLPPTLFATALLGLTGVLSFFVRAQPVPAPAE